MAQAINRADQIKYGDTRGQRPNVGTEMLSFDPATSFRGTNRFLFGDQPGIQTQEITDPMKQRVASPLSRYLESQIGKGLPQYPGQVAHEFTQEEDRAYSDFLALDAGDWYDKAVADPATKRFKEELLPGIREGFAGSLRGSGRFRAEEAGVSEFTEMLATGRYQAERDIPKQQFEMAVTRKQQMDITYARKYSAWMATLPQTNPALTQAMQFLQEGTSTGTDILTMNDPGSKGIIGDILAIFAGLV